ncbi:chromosome segregation protein SMC [Marinoscillum furvescens]|uniref:Chromosome partition protein Smc n=1 Tax=Marinoscillum furvescens DSM 4134 TaxID=1122208 RepID=A0A3D9L2V7_MARFU|nr:chromosome segregation protein SMC [Marinoscillum furvescens]RED96112.1 condensin subunit Smc [Marinoscillum furvescens DSM 4134]
MQLTRLEIKGFKSFADKVTINFDEGITGIVGPNGCGKSNVVDSIRWVLGEQKTRVLRSDKMENVIFNGTKARKATQLAEVSLTFNNTKNLIPTEYSQVTITRRYFRSGESEYLLNGVPCRLKDIKDLFLDTGIASNTYAIIELKMVDDLLNDKDNSRRALFEEAAGISKFKIRKKETLRKLSDTDADLDRVEDLLFEIEKNLKSLEKQARQAKKYYEIKEEYKKYSVALAKKSIDDQNKAFKEIEKQIEQESDRKNALKAQLAEKEAVVEKTKAELISSEKLLASRQKTLNEHVTKIRNYESEKKIKNERQRYLQDKIDKLQEQISQDKQSNERAQFSLQSLDKERDNAQQLLSDISQKLEELQEDYQLQKNKTHEAQEILNETNQQYNTKREQVYQIGKDLEIKEVQVRTLQSELTKSREDTSVQSESLKDFDQKLEEITREKELKTEEYQKLKAQETALKDKIEASQQRIDLIREELTQVNRKLDSKQNEYNLTKSLVDSLEGFPEAIKFLKKSKQWQDAPLLSDVIACPEEYRIAIENFLEPFMNYYVVDSHTDALKAVNLLSDASRGRAHFFILDKLEGYSARAPHMFANAQPATEVVEYDERYKKLIAHLLDNVYIYENELPAAPSEDIVFVSKSGQVTQRQYAVSGGSVGLFEGKRIGRAKNLEKLAETIKDLTKKQEKAKTNLNQQQAEIEQLKQSTQSSLLEELQQEISQVNEKYVSLQTKQQQYTELLSNAETKREDIEDRIQELTDELEALRPEYENSTALLSELELQVTNQREELNELNELLTQKSSAYNEQNVLYHRQQNKINSIKQEISYKDEAYVSSAARIEQNTEELQKATQDLNDLVKKSEESDDDLVEMYEEKESIEAGVNEAEKAYYEVRGNIDEDEKALRELQRMQDSASQVLMEWQNKLNETKMQLNSIKDRLSVEFNLDLNQIEAFEDEEMLDKPQEELRERVDKLKNRIDNMGPINPMAMEAYEEIKERHDFIAAQKEDLLKAKESLMATISEIDEVARVTFLEAFEKIRENFMKVFRTLFTEEDDCELKLTDPDSPLDSSIEIMAKPKGKRPLTINQLSGGEKTLTATSLLFAIYLLKPAPFCIFDEVDAPLDDANIDKFNQIIRQFSKESQFIIVTHNKRTMASTDVIYGITMIEQGVSRVVPVDLRELA